MKAQSGFFSILFFFLSLYFILSCHPVKKAEKTTVKKKIEKKDTLPQVEKEEQVKIIYHEKKPTYKIALILPFSPELVQTNLIDEENSEAIINEISINSLKFYEGALLAIDSLQKTDLNLELFVYDCADDTAELKKLLDMQPVLPSMQMLVGSNYNQNLHLLSDFAKQYKIFLLSPFSPSPSVTFSNPYYLISNPTLRTHCRVLFDFIQKNYRHGKYFMVQQRDEKNKFMTDFFRNSFKQSENSSELKEVFYDIESRFDSTIFSLVDTNVIIVPSMDEVFVNNALGKLKNLSQSYKVVVFGMPTWNEMESLRVEYLQNLNVHLSSSFWVDVSDTLVMKFEKNYFNKFKTVPSTTSYLGYDITFWLGKIFGEHTLNIPVQITNSYKGLSLSFEFHESYSKLKTQGSDFDFFENHHLHIIKFENYSLKKVN